MTTRQFQIRMILSSFALSYFANELIFFGSLWNCFGIAFSVCFLVKTLQMEPPLKLKNVIQKIKQDIEKNVERNEIK